MVEMLQNAHACRPDGPPAKVLIDTFFARKVAKTLREEKLLSASDTEVLGRALHRMNLIFQGKKLVEGLTSVFRGPEPISEYRKALVVLEDKRLKASSSKQLTKTLAAVHDEIENVIKAKKVDPKATKTATVFFDALETRSFNGDLDNF